MTTDKTPTAPTAEERALLRDCLESLSPNPRRIGRALLDSLDAAERRADAATTVLDHERRFSIESGKSGDDRILALEAELAAAKAKLATREMQQDIAVNATEAMTAAFERSQADLARVTDERDRAFRDGSKEPTRERDEHRAALNRIADRLRVVHEDPWIEAAVLEDSPINSGPCDCGLDADRKEAGL